VITGDLIKSVRAEAMEASPRASGMAMWVADRFPTFAAVVPPFLNVVSAFHGVLGAAPLAAVSGLLNRASGHLVPQWNPYMPRGAAPLQPPAAPERSVAAGARELPRKVVYMPSCVTRMMGPARSDSETEPVHAKLLSILRKVRLTQCGETAAHAAPPHTRAIRAPVRGVHRTASNCARCESREHLHTLRPTPVPVQAGYEVVYPEGISGACCGMIFNSRGFAPAAAKKMAALEASLLAASEGGKLPVICDTSPCLAQIKTSLSTPALRFSLYEPVEFINHFLVDKLEWRQVRASACHACTRACVPPCDTAAQPRQADGVASACRPPSASVRCEWKRPWCR
jgi:D-lactate dehydrogenase